MRSLSTYHPCICQSNAEADPVVCLGSGSGKLMDGRERGVLHTHARAQKERETLTNAVALSRTVSQRGSVCT